VACKRLKKCLPKETKKKRKKEKEQRKEREREKWTQDCNLCCLRVV
jgi:hypothetical protein